MSEKNKKICKASWLAVKIEFWCWVEKRSKKLNDHAQKQIRVHNTSQNALLIDANTGK